MAIQSVAQSPSPDGTGGVSRLPLVAYARDRETLAILSDALAPVLGSTAEFRPGGVAQAKAGLQRLSEPISALIVDVSGEPTPLAALEDLAFYVEPGVRVLVVGDLTDMEFYRQVTRGLGVQEYIAKPLNRDIVARSFLPVLTGAATAPARSGQIVTVTGVTGGVGATTVAVNLAAHLADRARHHILLLDADLHSGAAALMLASTTGGGLRAALENPGRVDVLFTERSSPVISDRLHLLAGDEGLDQLVVPAEGAAHHLASILCNRYNVVLVDLPRHVTRLNTELRELAHVRVLVMDATLPSMRETLRHLGLPRGPRQVSRPIVVLNRLGEPGSLTRRQVFEGLSGNVDIVIPWLPKKLKMAVTLGKPSLTQRGPFHAAIVELANEIVPTRQGSAKSWLPMRRRAPA